MKKLLLLLVIGCSLITYAQIPQPTMLSLKGIGGNDYDEVNTLTARTADGGFILGMYSFSAYGTGNIDASCNVSGYRTIFNKYNADGTVLEWSKCYKWDGDTTLFYPFPQPDGSMVLGGYYNNTSGWGAYICKQDAMGNIVWSRGYSRGTSLSPTCMIATDDGGYLIGGASFYTDTNIDKHYGGFTESDIFVLKIDSLGNKIWCKVIGGTDDDYVKKLLADGAGGYYVIGSTNSDDHDCSGNHGASDGYIARIDGMGTIKWHRAIGGALGDAAVDAVADGKGGLIIIATAYSTDGDIKHYKGGVANVWALQVDSTSKILWENCYGGGFETASSLCKSADGSIWMAGQSTAAGGDVEIAYGKSDAWFVHADSAGNFLNAKVVGSKKEDRGMLVWPLSNSHVLGGGFYGDSTGNFNNTKFYGGDGDAFLVEFAPWNQTSVKQSSAFGYEIKVYPNPTDDDVFIKTKKPGSLQLTILNATGRTMYRIAFIGHVRVDVREWPRGIYHVQVGGEDGTRSVQQVLVK